MKPDSPPDDHDDDQPLRGAKRPPDGSGPPPDRLTTEQRVAGWLGMTVPAAHAWAYRVARTYEPQDAADIAQSVVVNLIVTASSPRPEPVSSPRAYIRRATEREVQAIRRRRRVHLVLDESVTDKIAADVDAEIEAILAVQRDQIRRAVRHLKNADTRHLINIILNEDVKSVSVAAKRVGIPDSTARSRIESAARDIRQQLRRWGYFPGKGE